MATKTISVDLEAYDRLSAARIHERESFSEVIRRATWPREALLGADLLSLLQRRGSILSEEVLDRLEEVQRGDQPAADKWRRASSSKPHS